MKWLILVHVVGATVWVGGHLILSIGFVPRALQVKDVDIIVSFERSFERIGIPALLAQISTGLWMAGIYIPPRQWFTLASAHHQLLWIKLGLVLATLLLALHARFFIIPRLSVQNLPSMVFHIWLVTLLAMGLLLTGLSFRYAYF
ncbi:MAG: CopD family protein [Cyclobacteriaceae bacterium]|nr:CopD family protein [Cytophagales bacterium]MBX2898614.1 CopD family protein [Cyclobacteriaceae bacterium]